MGVPWHADASSCRFGYERAVSPILPGFWPARIPNGVLAEVDYRIVIDTARSLDERRAAFGRRRDWERFISAPTRPPILAAMAQDWFKLGMVEDRPGPADGAFPALMKVESGVGFDREPEALYPPAASFPQLGHFPLVVSNSDDNSLRLVDADAEVTVMPLTAPLERPEGLTRGLDGNIYVCCMDGNVIRRVTPKGEVSLFADGSVLLAGEHHRRPGGQLLRRQLRQEGLRHRHHAGRQEPRPGAAGGGTGLAGRRRRDPGRRAARQLGRRLGRARRHGDRQGAQSALDHRD